MEDVEKMVRQAVHGGDVEFIPAGLTYCWRLPRSFLRRDTRSETLLLGGVHPNCESMTLLFSDGRQYRSINHFLKKPLGQVITELAVLTKRIEPQLERLDPARFWQRQRGKLLLARTVGPWVLGTVRLGRLLRTLVRDVPGALTKPVRRWLSPNDPAKHRRSRRLLRVAVLPFEEQHSVDAARMESCKAVFAYEDVEDGSVKTIPACMWYPYRNPILEKIAGKYKAEAARAAQPAPAAAE
jgi:hypothetical protein